MTTLINAVSGTGLTTTADGSGVVKLQSNGVTTNALAWVNFAGASGSVTSGYNVSSVTRSAVGTYVVNYTNALADANYTSFTQIGNSSAAFGASGVGCSFITSSTTTTTGFITGYGATITANDYPKIFFVSFGN